MTRQSKRAQAADLALLEPEEGFEPSTFRLRVETHSSSRCQPGLSWLLRSAGSSIQCAPDLPRYGRGNDQGNDQPATTGLPDRGYVPIPIGGRSSPRIHRQTADR